VNALRVVLFVAGVVIMTTGIDVGLGGITTLGWQGSNDFLAVTDRTAFAVHDSHIRFLGGVWLGLGLLVAMSARDPRRHRERLKLLIALVFAGGLARLAQFDAQVLLDAGVIGSLVAEVVGMPVLHLWLAHATSATGVSGASSTPPRTIPG
jgi:hypothetical protein